MAATVSSAAAASASRPTGSERSSSARPGLLLAACQAPEHEQAHQAHEDQPEGAGLERDLPADGVETLRPGR